MRLVNIGRYPQPAGQVIDHGHERFNHPSEEAV